MYFEPVSAWLVALLFDGTVLVGEKTKGGVINEYYRKSIEQESRSLNGNIRNVRAKYQLIFPEEALRRIQMYIRIAKNSFSLEQMGGQIILDPDNQDYIIALLQMCVKQYRETEKMFSQSNPEKAEEYRVKATTYQKVICNVKRLKEQQAKELEEYRIRTEKENQRGNAIMICAAILVVLMIVVGITL